jgi:hypothetical protein
MVHFLNVYMFLPSTKYILKIGFKFYCADLFFFLGLWFEHLQAPRAESFRIQKRLSMLAAL